MLQIRDNLNELKDLAYTIKAHRSILDCANDEEIVISAGKYKFHQDFVSKNALKIKQYKLASETPSEMLDRKINFLTGLKSWITPHPWNPDQTSHPDLSPLIDGASSFLQEQKSRIKSEKICLCEDISAFSDDYLQDFVKNYASIPIWSRVEFRDHWARNLPPSSLPPGVDFVNRPSQVSSVFDQNETIESDTIPSKTGPSRSMQLSDMHAPTCSVSKSEQDLFGEDSNNNIKILPSSSKMNNFETI